MKLKFFLLFFAVNILLSVDNYAHDLRTPRNTPVEHSHPSDTGWYGWQWGVYGYYTQEQWSTWSDEYYEYEKERIARANQAYNCHAYAWAGAYQSDPNTYCWINTPNERNYFQEPTGDGSYDEISSTVATHANYTVEDHSLQLTGGTYNGGPEVISKWGKLPLYRHKLLDDPYEESAQNVKYFRRSVDVPEDHYTIPGAISAAVSGQTINVSNTQSLTANISVPSGITLSIKSSATVNLNGYYVKSTGGTITVEGGATINGYTARITQSDQVKGYYSTFAQALSNVTSGQTIELYNPVISFLNQSATWKENFLVCVFKKAYGSTPVQFYRKSVKRNGKKISS